MDEIRRTTSRCDIIRQLEHDPLRNIVLLKHLSSFPGHTQAVTLASRQHTATLVLLDASASEFDRNAYPEAAYIVLILSEDQGLTRELLEFIPADRNLVFKLFADADLHVVEQKYRVERRTGFLSFTSDASFPLDRAVVVADGATDTMFEMYQAQGHSRQWLEPLLTDGRAFTCALETDDAPLSACFAFESHGRLWEIGGVITLPSHRGRGLGSRVVRIALRELKRRKLQPRYQVNEDNLASISLARSIGMKHFLSLTHYLHARSAS